MAEQANVGQMVTKEVAAGKPLVEVTDLRMEFLAKTGNVVALENTTLEIRNQEFLCIVGPSGCGKSTFLLLTAGLLQPTGGQLLIEGKPLDGPYTNAGIAFQTHELLEWRSVMDNVMLPVEIRGLDKKVYGERAKELIDTVGLTGFERSYPHQLSGGMRQRAALCRAMVCNLPLLLMDEPFGALDAISRQEHQEMLQRVWMQERKTVLFITHDVREAILLADRVGVMTRRPGKIDEMMTIELPRPRTQEMTETPEFNEYVGHIRRRLFDTTQD